MTLRIVSWNCGMRAHDKVPSLLSLRPDLVILAECAEPDVLRRKAPEFTFADCEWSGTNRHKGLGVFSFGGLSLRRHESWDRRFHIFVPLEVRGTASINLLAVWAFNRRVPPVVTPNPLTTSEAVTHYRQFLTYRPSVVAGDFNASVIWDTPGKANRFAIVDAALRDVGLTSVYHESTRAPLGQESQGTLYFLKNRNRTYHIDYVYVPQWVAASTRIALGKPDEWLHLSDHVPLIVDLVAHGDAHEAKDGAAEQGVEADEAR